MKHTLTSLSSILLVVAFAAPAAATAPAADSPSAASSGFSIMFVSGGATAQGREHMKKMAADYDLLLDFKAPKDDQDYTNVDVRVTDDNGQTMLDAGAGGPLFYIQIAPGDYTVTADLEGHQLARSVHVAPHETSKLTFDWRT